MAYPAIASYLTGNRSTNGTSTAAGAGGRSSNFGSNRTSGCQSGGDLKRCLNPSEVRRPGGTAGKCASIPVTGTLRGSKFGILDKDGIAMDWDIVQHETHPQHA